MPFPLSRRTFRCVAFCLSFLLFPCSLSVAGAEEFAPEREEFFQPLFFEAGSDDVQLTEEEKLDLRCLLSVYPAIRRIAAGSDGSILLVMGDGSRVPYRSVPPAADDVKASMAQPYPPEPLRPPTPAGVAPGRVRSAALLAALYGESQADVRSRLVAVPFVQGTVVMHWRAVGPLMRVTVRLQAALREDPSLRPWLKSDGGFAWRRIAGENRLSAHARGIAVDISARRAPYWRWSKVRPHPLQKTYPAAIVRAFEEEGFIWGGKWHEYDIMHFEYRPELLCKARVVQSAAEREGADTPAGADEGGALPGDAL